MNQILPEFQKFMADRKLAAENQIPFYAGWASKFIRFSNVRQSTPTDLETQLFLGKLKKNPKTQDWQIVQAQNAPESPSIHLEVFRKRNALNP